MSSSAHSNRNLIITGRAVQYSSFVKYLLLFFVQPEMPYSERIKDITRIMSMVTVSNFILLGLGSFQSTDRSCISRTVFLIPFTHL